MDGFLLFSLFLFLRVALCQGFWQHCLLPWWPHQLISFCIPVQDVFISSFFLKKVFKRLTLPPNQWEEKIVGRFSGVTAKMTLLTEHYHYHYWGELDHYDDTLGTITYLYVYIQMLQMLTYLAVFNNWNGIIISQDNDVSDIFWCRISELQPWSD